MDKKELLRLLEIHTKGTGLFPEAMMAQMITESGMNNEKGLSQLSSKYNNYSGQKASGVTLSKGKEGVDYVIMGTEEDLPTKEEAEAYVKEHEAKGETGRQKSKIEVNPAGGFTVTLGQPFRIFKTPEEGVSGHVRFLTGEGYQQSQKDRYAKVRAAKTPEEQIKQLKEAGYATDSEYVNTVTSVLNDSVRVDFPQFATYTPRVLSSSTVIEQTTTEEDDDLYSDENINAAVDKFVDWANSDNPEQAILDAVDKVNNEADKKKLQKAAENAIAQKERSKKVSNIKNKDNLDYLKRRATAGAVELSDEDNTIIQNIAEEQRIQWSKLGKPGLLDLAKNALGMSQGDISVDDDAANAVMRRQVINSLSEDIDINTASGKQLLRQRIKAYTDLIHSDEYKEKVETLTGGGIKDSTYENMIDDLSSDYQVFIVDANKIHNLEGNDAINYEIKSQEHLDKNLDNEGVLSDNKATIQNLIADGNTDLANDVAERGLDAVAVDLANAQNEAAKRGETDATAKTLLALADKEAEMAVEKKSMDEGVAGLEAIDFGEVDEDEEEITTTFDEWKKNNPDGTLEDWQKEQKNTKNTSNNKAKISGAEKVLTGLKAAAGILSLSQALRAPDVETPEISPLVTEALHKQKALAESGLTAKEKGAAMQNLNDAYAGAMKNVLRASGGQRGMFLANQGTVDANRIQGLNQLAAQDAALHRQNIGQYNQLASSVGSMKLSRDMNVEQMRQATLSNNRQILSGVGSNLLSDAISDVSYYMNPNREKTQALFDQLSKGQNADTSGFDSLVETANTDSKNQKQVDKDQVANQKKIKG